MNREVSVIHWGKERPAWASDCAAILHFRGGTLSEGEIPARLSVRDCCEATLFDCPNLQSKSSAECRRQAARATHPVMRETSLAVFSRTGFLTGDVLDSGERYDSMPEILEFRAGL